MLNFLFKASRNKTMSRKMSSDCIDRFTAAVKRHRRQKRIDTINEKLNSVSAFLFGGPNLAYAYVR
ncbi:hypothetical protein LCGC14_0882670 [marine sediment metagenome]|uniref:Uncharacterized protein n=1 Tax=marine sediment metagenome TaxID=412755 RepID=A0A0F9P6C8_9ZZZZ